MMNKNSISKTIEHFWTSFSQFFKPLTQVSHLQEIVFKQKGVWWGIYQRILTWENFIDGTNRSIDNR